jgi:hypothetical protein
MVERPIKKSERQAKLDADKNSGNSDSIPPVESNPKSSKGRGERSSGKGRKKGAFSDESKQQVNPALARGPKPVKPQPKATTEPETDSESTPVEAQEETAGA